MPKRKHKEEGLSVDGLEWLADTNAVKEWLAKYELPKLLKKNKGLVLIENFLPEQVAEEVCRALEGLPKGAWESAVSDDKYEDDINHSFCLSELEQREDVLFHMSKVLWMMMPDTLPNFTAARYGKRDHIAEHDDRVLERYTWQEYRQLMRRYSSKPPPLKKTDFDGNGGPTVFSREVAVVLYFNKDWQASFGGELVDMVTGKHHLPAFNSLVAFQVPRMHMVTPVKAPPGRSRYSLFGWWLVKGKLYEPQGGEEEEEEEEEEEVEVMSLEEARALGI